MDGNDEAGIIAFGSDVSIVDSAVLDTRGSVAGGAGNGITILCHPIDRRCGALMLESTIISSAVINGLQLIGTDAVLRGVEIRDIEPAVHSSVLGEYGHGIDALCDFTAERCGTVDILNSLVISTTTAGLNIEGASGSVTRSVVREVRPRPKDELYDFGYGIAVTGVPGAPPTVFSISSCLIEDPHLAGILYYSAGGLLRDTTINGGDFSVVLNADARPDIQDDNTLQGHVDSDPIWIDLDPPPAPEPLLPFNPDDR